MRLLHGSENFPVFYHSTSFILSVCGCCMGKGSYRNTKYKYMYVIRQLGTGVGFSLWFLCVCFVFYGTLSKNDHAAPTCVTGLDLATEYTEYICWGPCYVLIQWMGLPGFSVDQGSTQIYSGNKAALVNILRKQGTGPNLWGIGMWKFGKHFWNNKTFATTADSDQPAHPHEHGYNLHADYTIWWKNKYINK